MNVCELRIAGVERDVTLAAARWELFAFAEIRHLYRIGSTNQVVILYDGAQPDDGRWIAALDRAGYTVEQQPSEARRTLRAV